MTMASESSVVLSVQQLLDEEEARQKSELAFRDAQRAREREQQRLAREAEATQAAMLARQAREEEQRLESMHQANLLQARLLAESEIALASQQRALQPSMAQRQPEPVSSAHQSSGVQRIVTAALATLLAGAVLCWALVIVPGQQRADQAYARLRAQHDAALDEVARRESALRHERELILEQLERAHNPAIAAVNSVTPPMVRRPVPRPNWTPNNAVRKPVCNCLATDPLCPCSP